MRSKFNPMPCNNILEDKYFSFKKLLKFDLIFMQSRHYTGQISNRIKTELLQS